MFVHNPDTVGTNGHALAGWVPGITLFRCGCPGVLCRGEGRKLPPFPAMNAPGEEHHGTNEQEQAYTGFQEPTSLSITILTAPRIAAASGMAA